MTNNKLLIACSLIVAATGCAQLERSSTNIDRAQQTIETRRQLIDENAGKASFERTARARLAGDVIHIRNSADLPPVFGKNINYSTQGSQTLGDVFDAVSKLINIPIHGRETITTNSSSSSAIAPGQNSALLGRVSIEHAGSVKSMLDEIAAKASVSWRYVSSRNVIEFYKFETRTLSVFLLPGAKNVNSSISLAGVSSGGSSSGGGSSSAGGGNVSVASNLSIDPWTGLVSGIQTILAEADVATGASNSQGRTTQTSNGRVQSSPDLGLVTVTARPATMERIVAYVTAINSRYARNILVDVKIYNVTLEDQAAAGFSIDALYSSSRLGAALSGGSPVNSGTGTPGRLTLRATDPSSPWNGSSLLVQALNQYGKVSLQTQGQVMAVNGQPSPIQVADEVVYLASSSTTQTPNVGSTTTLTPGTRVVGFTAIFTPLLLSDNRIMMQYNINISSLASLTQVSSGNNSIFTPRVLSQSIPGSAFLNDGESLVLFGFDQKRDTADSAASPSGISKSGRSERQMMVIVIQVSGGQKNG
jgi:type IVB pilus formation R64 PilN family outer membrane protein